MIIPALTYAKATPFCIRLVGSLDDNRLPRPLEARRRLFIFNSPRVRYPVHAC
jgi:hypothetical protein